MMRTREPSESGQPQLATVHLDLDGAKHIHRVHSWPWNQERDYLFESGLRFALETFDSAGVAATLFVIAEDLDEPRKRDLIVEAIERGHEIGSHSLTHRRLTTLSKEMKRSEILGSRLKISRQLGVDPSGFRAPALDIDRECLELVAAAGYQYDSSLFGGRARRRGQELQVPGDPPGRLFPGEELIELPLPDYRPLPVPFHPSYCLVIGAWYWNLGMRSFKRREAPLVLLFHLTDFSDPLPHGSVANRSARFFTLSHLSGQRKRTFCRRILEQTKATFRVTTTSRLLERNAEAAVGHGES